MESVGENKEINKRKAETDDEASPKRQRTLTSFEADGLAELETGSREFDAWLVASGGPGYCVLHNILGAAGEKHGRRDWACAIRAIAHKLGDYPSGEYFAKRSISRSARSDLCIETHQELMELVRELILFADRDQLSRVMWLVIKDAGNDTLLSVIVLLSAFGSSMTCSFGHGRAPVAIQPVLESAIAQFVQSQFKALGQSGFSEAIFSLEQFAPLWSMAIDTLNVWKRMHIMSRDTGDFNGDNYEVLTREAAYSIKRNPPLKFVSVCDKALEKVLAAVKFGMELTSHLEDKKEPLMASVSRGLVQAYATQS